MNMDLPGRPASLGQHRQVVLKCLSPISWIPPSYSATQFTDQVQIFHEVHASTHSVLDVPVLCFIGDELVKLSLEVLCFLLVGQMLLEQAVERIVRMGRERREVVA